MEKVPLKADLRLVYVEWEDSHGCSSSWEFLDQCQPTVTICQSVGWLIHEDKACLVLVPHMIPGSSNVRAQGCGDLTIPASAVRRMVNLTIPAITKRAHETK